MGYEVQMQKQILALLRLFHDKARDQETSAWVYDLIDDDSKWSSAHDLFDVVRDRLLTATGDAGRPPVAKDRIDRARVSQYAFEELCLKTIYNETDTDCPFDYCSPFWLSGSAIHLARELGVRIEAVIQVIAPSKDS